ncbi:MAG: NAD(P)/FAD-dependent oxidoreductase [Chloroflexota bacterium]
MANDSPPHIVILGGGFAGIGAARELARLLGKEEDGRITLVDQHPYQIFTPMLTEVVGGQIEAGHAVSAIHRLSPRINFMQGRVDRIAVEGKRVTVTTGDLRHGVLGAQRSLEADHLILALGSVTDFHQAQGVAAHALPMKTLGDAAAIRNRALALTATANAEPDEARRRAMLTFVVGGGGFSGVETMAALNDLARDVARRYPALRDTPPRTVLIHPGERLLPELGGKLARYAQQQLERRGVEVLLNTKITGAGEGYVELEGDRRIDTRLLVWAAGEKPSPVIETVDCPRGKHGGIKVEGTLEVAGRPGVWALGDCAEIPRPGGKGSYGPTAQNAEREGTLAARNIVARLRGEQPKPFVYTPIGELAIVGKRTGVARLYGHNFSGMPAWVMWRMIYLAKVPLPGKRVRIALDWLLDLLFGRETVALPIDRSAPAPDEA